MHSKSHKTNQMINKVNSSKKGNTNNEYIVGGYLHIFEKCQYNINDEYRLYINSEYAGNHKGFTLSDINKSINIIRCLKNEDINKVVYRLASKQSSDNLKDFEFKNKISDEFFITIDVRHICCEVSDKTFTYPKSIEAYETSDKEVFTEKEKAIEHQKRLELDQKIKDDLQEVELNFGLSDTTTLALYISDFIFSNLEFIKKL